MLNEPLTSCVTVAAQKVHKSFGAKTAVSDVSFSASAGELVGLVGANGGGKTTLLRMLTGALKPDAGVITLLQADPPFDNATRAQIGYVPQVLSLYSGMTVLENLRFYADIYGVEYAVSSTEGVITRFDLGQFSHTRVSELSGGWARVAQLGASLIHKPKVLLLDEPTAGLDASMRARFWSELRRYANKGNTVIISTHDLDEAQQCDRILFLSQGNALFNDTPITIIEQSLARVLFINTKDISGVIKKINELQSSFVAADYLGGLKVTFSRMDEERFEAVIREFDASFRALQPSLADACGLELAKRLK